VVSKHSQDACFESVTPNCRTDPRRSQVIQFTDHPCIHGLDMRFGSVLNVCCQLLSPSFQSPNRTYLHLFFALIGVFGIEKPVRFWLLKTLTPLL
jgi:hypothetical protein